MEYFLTDDQIALKEKIRAFAEEKIKPVRVELDLESRFPAELLSEMGKMGLFRLFVPKEYGGDGLVNMHALRASGTDADLGNVYSRLTAT